MSYRPDHVAVSVDAFSPRILHFTRFHLSVWLLEFVLQKVQQDEALRVLVVPDWPTQAWYPVVQLPAGGPCPSTLQEEPSTTTQPAGCSTSSDPAETSTHPGLQDLRQVYQQSGSE